MLVLVRTNRFGFPESSGGYRPGRCQCRGISLTQRHESLLFDGCTDDRFRDAVLLQDVQGGADHATAKRRRPSIGLVGIIIIFILSSICFH